MVTRESTETITISIEEILKKFKVDGDFVSAGFQTHTGKRDKKTNLVIKTQKIIDRK